MVVESGVVECGEQFLDRTQGFGGAWAGGAGRDEGDDDRVCAERVVDPVPDGAEAFGPGLVAVGDGDAGARAT
nr:hypothetical protein [Streptomyces endocoffeicus]